MKVQKGFAIIEILIILIILFIITIIPISCHQNILRTQQIMAKTEVEMTYWDIFWTNPKIIFNQGEIKIKEK